MVRVGMIHGWGGSYVAKDGTRLGSDGNGLGDIDEFHCRHTNLSTMKEKPL